jgi:hypothetical protein
MANSSQKSRKIGKHHGESDDSLHQQQYAERLYSGDRGFS